MKKYITSIFDEIIVDNFAGGGGASTGIELALGRPVDIAINHDPDAIEMHKKNHPYTEHLCESVWDVDPVQVCRGRKIALAWFSPDCTHFSKAKGGKPVKKEIRGLAWVTLKWAKLSEELKPRVIMLENVEEFKTWGPLTDDGYPDPEHKGETFNDFVDALRACGYEVQWRELKACDYGAPTTRKRFFLIARSDGQHIVWPEPTHAAPESEYVSTGEKKPYIPAKDIIDWSIPAPSIFERKKPLSEATQKRIARGIFKYVINNPNPFVLQIGQTGFSKDRNRAINEPLSTIVSKNEHCVIVPTIMVNNTGHPGSCVLDPIKTITSGGHHALVTPTLLQMGFPDNDGKRICDLDDPLKTICSGGNKYAIATAFLEKSYGGNYSGAGTGMHRPVDTITAIDHNRLCTLDFCNYDVTIKNHHEDVNAFLIKYYGQGIGQEVNEPLHTIPSKDRFAVITVKGIKYHIVDIGLRMLTPRELYNAQGFPPDYEIEIGASGKRLSKAKQVARCGNSVPPAFATALVKANLPEYAVTQPIITMAGLNERIAYYS